MGKTNTISEKQTLVEGSTPSEEQIVSKKVTMKAGCDFALGIALEYARKHFFANINSDRQKDAVIKKTSG